MLQASVRVCLVSPMPPPYGGVSRWTELLHRLAETQSEIEIIQVDTASRWRSVQDLSIIKRVFGGGLQLVGNYFTFIITLIKKPDVVHLTTPGSLALIRNWVMCVTARLFRIPVVFHIRFGRVSEIAGENTLEWRMLVNVMRKSDVVIAITPQTVETIKHHLPGINVQYVPNPVDCSEIFLPLKGKSKGEEGMVLFLGWTLPTKGVEELVQAWSEIEPKNWVMFIAGPGSKSYQHELICRYAPGNLSFVGELDHEEAMKLMAQCDIFVLPSYTEGFPNVILESMAFGKAIIATMVGAIPEMLSGDCGLLIPPKNKEELKAALSKLIQNKSLRYDLGGRALEKVRLDYNSEIIFDRYCQIWKGLARNGRISYI